MKEIETLWGLEKNGSSYPDFTIDEDGLHLNGYTWVKVNGYKDINPASIFYYDTIISVDAGNQFYIGWERYDQNYTSRSNNACIYPVAIKPTSKLQYQRYFGTVDLSTDTVNPCAHIKLRILNNWTGSASDSGGTATIHSLVLREASSLENFDNPSILKTGIVQEGLIRQRTNKLASFTKTGFIDANSFYEY